MFRELARSTALKKMAVGLLMISSAASAAERELESGSWNLLTLPGDSEGPVGAIFGEALPAETINRTWAVFTYDTRTAEYRRLFADDTINSTDAFWLGNFTGETVSVDLRAASSVPTFLRDLDICPTRFGCFTRFLAATGTNRWTLMGLPSTQSVDVDDLVLLTNDGLCAQGCSLAEANDAGVTRSLFLAKDAANEGYDILGAGDTLEPEVGYWFLTNLAQNADGARLVIPVNELIPPVVIDVIQPPAPETDSTDSEEPVNNTNANLLFSSGFESGVELANEDDGYQRLTGVDVETGFVWDESLNGVWGSSNNGIHVIDGGRSSTGIENELREVTGRDGTQTTALYQEIDFSDGSPRAQTPYQINNITEDPDEYYISYWMKMDDTSFDEDDKWRIVWQYKSDHFDYKDSRPGYRIGVYIYTNEDGPYWHVKGDDQNPDYWSVSNRDIPVPQDEWFQVEVYGKVSSGDDGRFWAKINGELLASQDGPNLGSDEDTMAFMMLWQLYGNADPKNQLIDDVQIWDGVPYQD